MVIAVSWEEETPPDFEFGGVRGCKPAPTLRGWPAALTAWRWGRRLPGSRRRSSGPGVTGELQNKAQNVQNLTDIDIRTGLCACPSVVAFPIFPPHTSTSAWAVLSTAPAEKQISRQHLDRTRFQGSTAGPSSMSSQVLPMFSRPGSTWPYLAIAKSVNT